MFAALWRFAHRVAAFFRRLVIDAPQNEYERIVFTATYSAGSQLRRGLTI